MSQPDIMDLIQVHTSAPTSGDVVAPVEQVAEAPSEIATEVNQEQAVESEVPEVVPPTEEATPQAKPETLGVQKRIDKLVKANADLKRQLDAVNAREAQIKESTSKDVDNMSFDDVVNAKIQEQMLAKEKASLQEKIQESSSQEWQEKINDAQAVHSDFGQVLEGAKELFSLIPPDIQSAFADFDEGALMAYELAKNPNLAVKLAKANPIVVSTILLELKQSVSKQAPQPLLSATTAPKQSSAPKPTPAPNQSNKVALSRVDMPMEDFIKNARDKGLLR
jgi:hypothetical protein